MKLSISSHSNSARRLYIGHLAGGDTAWITVADDERDQEVTVYLSRADLANLVAQGCQILSVCPDAQLATQASLKAAQDVAAGLCKAFQAQEKKAA